MANFDTAELALRAAGCADNTFVYDDKGMPSIYVNFPNMRLSELLADGDSSAHPAFLVNGEEITNVYIGKYQGKVENSRMYSLPGVDPQTYINHDAADTYCANKGAGHHIITNAEWALAALISKKLGAQPKGNNNYGRDVTEAIRTASPTGFDSNRNAMRVATGTGPASWYHNGQINGVWGMNGNVWEWIRDLRLVKGEVQVIPYNNASDNTVSTAANSTQWRAINAAATSYSNLYLTPNGSGTTSGSVKLNWVDSHWEWTTAVATTHSGSAQFSATTCASGISAFCRMYLEAMALCPENGDSDYGSDLFYAATEADETVAIRGGNWSSAADAGVFNLSLYGVRGSSTNSIGARPAYVKL